MKPFRLVTRYRPAAALLALAGSGLLASLATGPAPVALASVQATPARPPG